MTASPVNGKLGSYRTALVTGGTGGVGSAVVREFIAAGLMVTAGARAKDRLDLLKSEVGCDTIVLDLSRPRTVMQALEGRSFDVVVNNAGIMPAAGPFHSLPAEGIFDTVDVNLSGALAVTRALLPGQVERGSGHIFFVSSMFGPYAAPNAAVYGATKAALRAFSKGLRLDLVGTGVRVTEVAPGRIETEFFRSSMGDMAVVREKLFANYRSLQPSDVSSAIVYALGLPAHADVNLIELTSTDQALGGGSFATHKG